MAEAIESDVVRQVGQRVRDLRVARGMTLGDLGDVVGMQPPAISKFELHGVAKLATLEVLAWALDAELVVELRPRKAA